MCYDVSTLLKSQIKKAEKRGAPQSEIDFLKDKLLVTSKKETEEIPEYYYSSGFSHQKIPVITADLPDQVQCFNWGLIPSWVKDELGAHKIANQTLNARAESMFEKPSFRAAVRYRRCLIVVSGYFEHFWADARGNKKIPYYISLKNDLPMYLSGLWEEWQNPATGAIIRSASIVTTTANSLLAEVHNRDPENPRMLNILPHDLKTDWLGPIHDVADQQKIQSLISSYPASELNIHPVGQLRGKNGLGNSPAAVEPKVYHGMKLPLQKPTGGQTLSLFD